MASLVNQAETAVMGKGRTDAARDAGGQLDAVEALYRRHARRVYTLCLRLLADARAAEDATASAFVRLGGEVAGRRDDVRTLDRLLDLAVGESLSRLGVSYGEAASETASTPPRAAANTPRPLDAALLDRMMTRLPARVRIAFVLRDVEGFGDARVAALMGVGGEEVRRLVLGARAELRRLWLEQT